MVNSWLHKMNLEPYGDVCFPKHGVVAWDHERAIAVGFLRYCEGIGMLDTFVTNPAASSEARDKALDVVVAALLNKAQELKIDGVFAHSLEANILLRSNKFGFKKMPHTLIGLKLGVN